MNEDKSIHPKDLPAPQQDVDTKQAEEFVDKSSERKDEDDLPKREQSRGEDDAPRKRSA